VISYATTLSHMIRTNNYSVIGFGFLFRCSNTVTTTITDFLPEIFGVKGSISTNREVRSLYALIC
jgi:hypothetical protein